MSLTQVVPFLVGEWLPTELKLSALPLNTRKSELWALKFFITWTCLYSFSNVFISSCISLWKKNGFLFIEAGSPTGCSVWLPPSLHNSNKQMSPLWTLQFRLLLHLGCGSVVWHSGSRSLGWQWEVDRGRKKAGFKTCACYLLGNFKSILH